jgi:ParB-like chromosome segregation protein Spo0J
MSDELAFHPIADIFPLMEGEEFDALVADIKAHGLHEHIEICGEEGDPHRGKIIDGRNRYRACLAAGVEPTVVLWGPDSAGSPTPVEYVISKNIHRRHLTAEQKRELIAKLIKAEPEKSDRQIGRQAKASKNTVTSVRRKMERRGQVDHVEKRTDTRGRKQSAHKAKTARKAKPEPDGGNVGGNVDDRPTKKSTTIDEERNPKQFQQLELSIDTERAAAAKQDDPEDLAAIYANPIAAAWRAADEADRTSFARHYGADVVRLMGQTEEAAGAQPKAADA